MKYQVVDSVRIRPEEWFQERLKEDKAFFENCHVFMSPNISEYAGKTAKITKFSKFYDNWCYLDIDSNDWPWPLDSFEKIDLKEIE